MNEFHMKYLDMIQSVVSRMASNEFQARAWSVALGSAVIGFAASKDGNPHAALLAVIPVSLFWWLDAYFLALERRYRELYKLALKHLAQPPTFSLDSGSPTFGELLTAAWRPAVFLIHLPVFALALVVAFQTSTFLRPPAAAPVTHSTCNCATTP